MMRPGPFARFKAIMALLAAAARGDDVPEAPAYRSRGKGRGTSSRNYLRPCNNGGRGVPHQGAQERIRRRIEGFYAPPGNPSFTKASVLAAVERGQLVTYRDLMEFKYGN